MEFNKGDLFLLGKHRLIYGDALSLIDVQKLMDGKKAEMMFTDPPYNIHYSSEWRAKWRATRGDKSKKYFEEIKHDYDFDYQKWFKILETGIVKGSMYITNIYLNFNILDRWMKKYFKKENSIIIWIKNNHTLSRSDYHHLYEIIFYNRLTNGVWNGGRTQKDIWYVKNRYVGNYVHPTQKPLRLVKKAILNNSNEKDIILDMFGGLGSTLIAAEQTNRICYMMELDKQYVETIIKRWEQLTNEKAIKLT